MSAYSCCKMPKTCCPICNQGCDGFALDVLAFWGEGGREDNIYIVSRGRVSIKPAYEHILLDDHKNS